MTVSTQLDELCINTIRMLSADGVQKANSGHPGMPMGTAAMAYVLWTKHLKHHPGNPLWADRDRFVLSAGHGSMLLYSLLHLTGYDLSLDDIKNFRQWGSKTPGHPEYRHTPGVETTTGPLGQGFANAVGMAIAEKHLAAKFNQPDCQIVDHMIYGICGDGDLMEGISTEAASLAGHFKLGNLVFLYDDNRITIDGGTDITFTEDRAKKFKALNWQVLMVEDGNDISQVDKAIKKAKKTTDQPTLIICRTHIGFGSPHRQDTSKAHGSPLGPDELKLTKEHLNWPVEPMFHIPADALAQFRKCVKRGKRSESQWLSQWETYQQKYPELAAEFQKWMDGEFPEGWDSELTPVPADPKGEASRKSSQKTIQKITAKIPNIIGGSADLAESNLTHIETSGLFQAGQYANRNIPYGIREHAMAAISNGIALHGGLIPFCASFLVFTDYCRPSIRLAALMGIQVIYVFTHDSIGVGEDGPTHQPIEQVMSLRGIPNLWVMRPGDANETIMAWKAAVLRKDGPTLLALSRQNLPVLDRSKYASADGVCKGGYILADTPNQSPEIILIATGSEVSLAIEACETLNQQGIAARVVSLPCWELFDQQTEEYKNQVLPPQVTKRIAIEMGITLGWQKYTGTTGTIIGIDHFGASAPANILMEQFGFTKENIVQKALALLKA